MMANMEDMEDMVIPWQDRIRRDGDCWLWTGPQTWNGYPKWGDGSGAHRRIYELLVGPIPVGLDLDHLCRVRHCVNPEHLEPVTRRENLLRGDTVPARRAAMTHCAYGHEFTEENTRWYRGMRYCRACNRRRMEERAKRASSA